MAQPLRLQSICPDCGQPFDRDDNTTATCLDCRPTDNRPKASADRRGYDWTWRKLSERARALQPFCSDCGSPEDLTTDHTPEAWARRAAGKVIRLRDIDVVCRPCNASRGAARGERTNHRHRSGSLLSIVDACPVCRSEVHPTTTGNVASHADKIGRHCPMSGEPFPAQ